jgi:hypothetical protein
MLGITTLYVTHDQNEAMALADRIAILDQGRLQQIGTPTRFYRDPANAFVAGFVGLPPMTFPPVTVDGDMAILSFGWVRLSHEKANRVSDGEYLAGLRPEEITGDEPAGGVDASWRSRPRCRGPCTPTCGGSRRKSPVAGCTRRSVCERNPPGGSCANLRANCTSMRSACTCSIQAPASTSHAALPSGHRALGPIWPTAAHRAVVPA